MLAMKFMITHINLNEEKIFSQNYEAFKIMKKLLLDPPCLPCISKNYVSRDISKLEKKTMDGSFWKKPFDGLRNRTQYRYRIHL